MRSKASVRIPELQKNHRDKMRIVYQKREVIKKDRAVQAHQVLRTAAAALRTTEEEFNSLIEEKAKLQCRQLCTKMHATLPRELRDHIYDHIITENNVTFYMTKHDKITFVNGTSPLYHVLDEEYTGDKTHQDVLGYLCREAKHTMFDFAAATI